MAELVYRKQQTECGNDDVAPRPPSDPNAPGTTDAISFLAFLFFTLFLSPPIYLMYVHKLLLYPEPDSPQHCLSIPFAPR
ncbi:hypothetical protein VN97_g5059 [Penicillium thymicola]|uniref:Uncharacterized protein n=1 Tax=Penicillium thymicola TaxID=293382 RepID=A0AAI9TJF2_PENTH|nr:hypothetical protein VN97_g5059 [Penicillium thymicola]